MASSPPPPQPPPFPSLPHLTKPTINSISFSHSSFNRIRGQFKCQQHSSNSDNGAHHRWTVDCVTGSDPIHIILKPPASTGSSPMQMSSGLKNAKKVCLFYAAEMEALAKRIAAQSDAIELRSINWRYMVIQL